MAKSDEKKPTTVYARLVGHIDYDSAKDVLKDLDRAFSEPDILDVRLSIASPGGDLHCAFALYDQIKASPKPVDVVAMGLCMSAAVMVLQAARRRVARPHTVFMVHPTHNSVRDAKPYSEFITLVDQYKKNHDTLVELIIGRSGIPRAEFEKLYEPRCYLTPAEAKALGTAGLIDAIE